MGQQGQQQLLSIHRLCQGLQDLGLNLPCLSSPAAEWGTGSQGFATIKR